MRRDPSRCPMPSRRRPCNRCRTGARPLLTGGGDGPVDDDALAELVRDEDPLLEADALARTVARVGPASAGSVPSNPSSPTRR